MLDDDVIYVDLNVDLGAMDAMDAIRARAEELDQKATKLRLAASVAEAEATISWAEWHLAKNRFMNPSKGA